jgi:nitrogen fixation/metabolism regulation signal transduction histidine kinase
VQFPEVVQRIAQQLKNPISTILWKAEKIKRSIDCTTETEDEPDYSQLADFLVEDVGKLVRQTRSFDDFEQDATPPFQGSRT